jgi:hypothetical protein
MGDTVAERERGGVILTKVSTPAGLILVCSGTRNGRPIDWCSSKFTPYEPHSRTHRENMYYRIGEDGEWKSKAELSVRERNLLNIHED